MHKYLILLLLTLSNISFSQRDTIQTISFEKDSNTFVFVKSPGLKEQNWGELNQPLFWQKIMKLSPDSCLFNVARTRQVLYKESVSKWNLLNDDQKLIAKAKLREVHNLDSNERVFMTTGKSDFYEFELVYPSIKRGIEVFKANNTDPWYAQAILMIESPGKLKHSVSGAYGAFQLMKSVARAHGLKVNKYVDERKDFDKSAYGSAHLLRTSCIPEAKRIMRKFNVDISGELEYDLWFRLLVLHVYHAGAGNVEKVLTNVVKPDCGCQEVITTIWQSSYGNFRNSSQNYSQLALASLLVLEEFIEKNNQ
jgi:hypothetical protein